MSDKHLFLSYKRGAVTTPVVERLYNRIRVQIGGAGVKAFFDKRSIDAGDAWEPAIDDALARSTHFLAFISVDYWLSAQCQRELNAAVARYEAGGWPRLLFVLADQLDPADLAIEPAAAAQRLEADAQAGAPIKRVRSVGQINFLGPYDAGGRLVRLAFENPQALDDQLAAMVQSLRQLPSP